MKQQYLLLQYRLAQHADKLLILTTVEKVRINFKQKDEKKLDSMSLTEAKKFIENGRIKHLGFSSHGKYDNLKEFEKRSFI